MKAKGIVRKIDDLGRIVIPAEIRRSFGLVDGTELDLVIEGDRLVYTKVGASAVRDAVASALNALSEFGENVNNADEVAAKLKEALFLLDNAKK